MKISQIQRVSSIATMSLSFLLVTAPAHAHTVGGDNGLETEFLIPALVLVVGAFAYRARPGAKPAVFPALLVIGIALLAASAIVPRVSGTRAAPDAQVRIISPQNGDSVSAGDPVRIEADVVGGEVATDVAASDAGHLHIFVDGELQEMLYATETEVELEPGEHTITVEYTDAQHLSFDPPIESSVEVTAENK